MSKFDTLTCNHEAGHAVAAVARGGELRFFDMEATTERMGLARINCARRDWAFAAYAGPWCEAHTEWGDRPLDEADDDGCLFNDLVSAALMSNPDDLHRLRAVGGWTEEAEVQWHMDLIRLWPVVVAVGERLQRGLDVTNEDIEDLLMRELS